MRTTDGRPGRGVTGAIAGCAVALGSLTACSSPAEFDIPRTWWHTSDGSDVQLDEAKIVINADGLGEVEGLPIGDDNSAACVPGDADRYSGDVEWEPQGSKAIVLRSDSDTWVLNAGWGKFGSVSWFDTWMDFCPSREVHDETTVARFESFDF